MSYGKAALTALERGPMTIAEIAFEAGIGPATATAYVRYHLAARPPKAHECGAERSETTGKVVAIYASGPGQAHIEAA